MGNGSALIFLCIQKCTGKPIGGNRQKLYLACLFFVIDAFKHYTIVQPEKLDIDIGGHMAPNARVHWENETLHYHHNNGPLFDDKIIKPLEEEWGTFLKRLEELRVWDWKEGYHADILDGIQWSIEISFEDKDTKSWGNNCYPANNIIMIG